MSWTVEYTDEFGGWWATLKDTAQADISASVALLMEYGPDLPFPHSSAISGSRHALRELRVQSRGRPIRIFYAFDPRRSAILLIGGNKAGNKRFYGTMIPKADALYDEYIRELRREGLI